MFIKYVVLLHFNVDKYNIINYDIRRVVFMYFPWELKWGWLFDHISNIDRFIFNLGMIFILNKNDNASTNGHF